MAIAATRRQEDSKPVGPPEIARAAAWSSPDKRGGKGIKRCWWSDQGAFEGLNGFAHIGVGRIHQGLVIGLPRRTKPRATQAEPPRRVAGGNLEWSDTSGGPNTLVNASRNGSSSTIFRRTVTRSMPCSGGSKAPVHPQRVGCPSPRTADERARRQAMTWCFGAGSETDGNSLLVGERVLYWWQCAQKSCRWPKAARHGTVELRPRPRWGRQQSGWSGSWALVQE